MKPKVLVYRARNLVLLLRPQFLIASVVLFLLGTLAVGDLGTISDWPYVAAMSAFVLVQLSAALVNEYTDWLGDRFARKSLFAGGSGVVATGRVGASTALALGIATMSTAIALAWYVSAELEGRPLFLPLFLASSATAWAYSVRPIRLMETGLGEMSVTILLVWGVPMLAAYLVIGRFPDELVPYSVILSFFSMAALIGVEFPDKQADIRSGKRNLTYRFGVKNMARLQAALIFTGYAIIVALVLNGTIGWVNLLILITIIYGWAAVTLMSLSKYYSYEWARASTTVMMSIFVISMVLSLVDVAVF